jgi:hypothetical protein
MCKPCTTCSRKWNVSLQHGSELGLSLTLFDVGTLPPSMFVFYAQSPSWLFSWTSPCLLLHCARSSLTMIDPLTYHRQLSSPLINATIRFVRIPIHTPHQSVCFDVSFPAIGSESVSHCEFLFFFGKYRQCSKQFAIFLGTF